MAMIPIIYEEAIKFDDITMSEMTNLIAISQVTPGPIAVNAATYVGYNAGGFLGAFAATLGVSLPAFILVTIIVFFLKKFSDSMVVKSMLIGVRPVTLALIGSAGVIMVQSIDFASSPAALVMMVATIILMTKTKVSPIFIMLSMGAIGAVIFTL